MTDPVPGWYTDPSGLPGMFRWWNGRQWSAEVTSDPATPGPTGPVPPPPGAPGPGYVPAPGPVPRSSPSPWSPTAPDQAAEVLDSGHTGDGTGNRSALLVVLGIVVLVIIVGVAAFLAFGGGGASPSSAQTPSPRPHSPPRTDTPVPTPTPSGSPGGPATRGLPGPGTPPAARPPVLRFQPLGGKWQVDLEAAQMLSWGVAQTQVTEPRYDGRSDWLALLAAGAAPADTYDPKDLPGSARAMANWFAGSAFDDAKVTQETLGRRALTVDGHDGVLLKEHFSYAVKHLKSHGETVYLVVVDLGSGADGTPAGGAFLASIPDTDKALNSDVQRAVKSLTVAP